MTLQPEDDAVVIPNVRPVRRGYEQVADQIRDWITSGRLSVGDQLPTEAELARQFGISRSTVREALRTLSSESLIATRPGAGGGSTVDRPDPARITEILQITLRLLVRTNDLTLEELLAARETLEIPAASLAAANWREHHLRTLRTLLPDHTADMDARQLLEVDRAFHDTLLLASGNRLYPLIAAPLYEIVAQRFQRSRVAPGFWDSVVDQHRKILQAVEGRDQWGAAARMSAHLQEVRRAYSLMEPDDDLSPTVAGGSAHQRSLKSPARMYTQTKPGHSGRDS